MKQLLHIPGAVLPTVAVVSVLMVLSALAIISLWEADFLFFLRQRHDTIQRAHIESGFLLYSEYPEEVISNLDANGTLMLYDSIPHSCISITREPWGLYEKVTITGSDGKTAVSKILGKHRLCGEEFVLLCCDNDSAITLTGRTHIKGRAKMSHNGVIYGQMGSVFFSGEEIAMDMMDISDKGLPQPTAEALLIIDELGKLATGDLAIKRSRRLSDTIIVANKVHIEAGFKGSLQVFASDSITVAENVTLDYPSGLFSKNYIGIGDDSVVNGYVIGLNYLQSRLAKVRGLVYVAGTAQLQGMVSGSAMLEKAVYRSPQGYYNNTIFDATILENHEIAWPFWIEGEVRRKEIKWLN